MDIFYTSWYSSYNFLFQFKYAKSIILGISDKTFHDISLLLPNSLLDFGKQLLASSPVWEFAQQKNSDLQFIDDIILATGFSKTDGPQYLEKLPESDIHKARSIQDFLKDFPSNTRIYLIIRYLNMEQGIQSFENVLETLNSTSPLKIKPELRSTTPDSITTIPDSTNSYLMHHLSMPLISPKRVSSFSKVHSSPPFSTNTFNLLLNVIIID